MFTKLATGLAIVGLLSSGVLAEFSSSCSNTYVAVENDLPIFHSACRKSGGTGDFPPRYTSIDLSEGGHLVWAET